MPHPSRLSSTSLTVLLVISGALLSACDRREPDPTSAPATASSAALPGVTPASDLTGASDRSGPPAVGAMEAGQAHSGAKIGSPAQATGGDRAASGSASSPVP